MKILQVNDDGICYFKTLSELIEIETMHKGHVIICMSQMEFEAIKRTGFKNKVDKR
jgi:hypothetical protein